MLPIIDGDVVAYLACKARHDKTYTLDGETQIIRLDSDGKRIAIEFTPEDDAEYLEASWGNFKNIVTEIQEMFFADDYLMAVKSPHNFRNDLYPEYKMNRHANKDNMNLFVPELRKRAVKAGLAIESDGREADDYIRIWAEEARAGEVEHVVCTIDKDLKCIPGKFYDLKKKELITISEEEARRHYYEQLLKGDSTDNIPGIPGIGPKKAEKALAECVTEADFQEVVVDMYLQYYNDAWEEYLLSNGKMIHLQASLADYFSLKSWPVVQELRC